MRHTGVQGQGCTPIPPSPRDDIQYLLVKFDHLASQFKSFLSGAPLLRKMQDLHVPPGYWVEMLYSSQDYPVTKHSAANRLHSHISHQIKPGLNTVNNDRNLFQKDSIVLMIKVPIIKISFIILILFSWSTCKLLIKSMGRTVATTKCVVQVEYPKSYVYCKSSN